MSALDKSRFGDGPWMSEPDQIEFHTDEGYAAAVRRNALGALCGYVAVPRDHALFGLSYNDVDADIDVHGGLTYSDARPDSPLWTFGFDCAHSWDLVPSMVEYGDGGTYRDIGYVTNEVRKLSKQLAERAK